MERIINKIFYFICLFLPFVAIPKIIQVGVIGNILHSKLVFHPIFIGLIYTLYCQYKYKNTLINYNKFLKFIIIYFSVIISSLVIGLYTYPYYDLVLKGSDTQIEKLSNIINILNNFEIYIDEKILTTFLMVARTIKNAFLEMLYTFGGAYIIYC